MSNYDELKAIMINPEFKNYLKLKKIYDMFTTTLVGEELTNNNVHVYNSLYGHREIFTDKFFSVMFTQLILYYKDRGLDINKIDRDFINTPEFGEYLLEKGIINTSHTISCSCCSHPVFVDVVLNFNDLTITATYSDDNTKPYAKRFNSAKYGTVDNPCVDLINNTKFNFNFKCRSGKIVIANSLREIPLYSENEPKEYISINEKFGMMTMMRHWEKHNFLYMQCGNNSPTIFQNENGEVLLGNNSEDCECDADPCECKSNPLFDHYEDKGYVCTDLWAVNIVDYEDFKEFESKCDFDYTILDVSKLGEDIIVEYHEKFQDWDDASPILLTMKGK